MAVAVSSVAEALHRVGARAAVGPEAEPDRAFAFEGSVGVGADAALAGAAAALVDVDAVAAVAGELVAGITNAPAGKEFANLMAQNVIFLCGGAQN